MMRRYETYNYVQGKQIMDQGTRIYDVAGHRLPSVTTILSKTKNQNFLKEWKAKVGEKKAERIKNVSSARDCYAQIPGVIYHGCWIRGSYWYWDRRQIMAEKSWKWALHQYRNILVQKSRVHYWTVCRSNRLVCLHNDLETVVDFKQSKQSEEKRMDRRLLSSKNHGVRDGTRLCIQIHYKTRSNHGMHA